MERLNYHHLLYFWHVVHDGGLAPASKRLRLAPSTLSGQLRVLADTLGEELFVRQGRRLVLTEMGRVAYRYASEIFALGGELQEVLRGRPTDHSARLVVGIADVLPKLVVRRLLAPALALAEPAHLVCREDTPERLLADLAVHELDVVLSDSPVPPSTRVRGYNHLLGECGISFLVAPKLAPRVRGRFPRCLDGAPMLVPTEHTTLRRGLEQWFQQVEVRPRFVGEFEDSALLKVFGETGLGIFPVPTVIEAEVRKQHGARVVGRTLDVRERFYAISVERRLKNPAVVAICEGARVAFGVGARKKPSPRRAAAT